MRPTSHALAAVLLLTLAACSHKPLKAPCDAGEARPVASLVAWLGDLIQFGPNASDCGPSRRLNLD